MTHERCIERLSEHLDGALAGAEARAVEEHLAGCAVCASVEAELRSLVGRARALDDRPPSRDLWPGIAAAIGSGEAGRPAAPTVALPRRRRRVTLSDPQLAAARLALALASGGAAWWARPLASPPAGVAGAPTPEAGAVPASATLPQERGWAEEVERLQAALAAAEGLDATTVRVLERNLEIIDRAIRESREALASDPGNPFLEEHLARSWARKVATLKEAADLAAWPRS